MSVPSALAARLSRRLILVPLSALLPLLLSASAAASSLPARGAPAVAPPSGRAAVPLSASKKVSASKAAASKALKPGSQPVVLYHVNRRETLRLRLTDERGRPVPGMQRQVESFLR